MIRTIIRSMIRTSTAPLAVLVACLTLHSQDLSPRAYLITPTGSHAVILSSSFNSGNVLVDPSVPIEDAKGSFQVQVLGYYQSFGWLGRSSNLTVIVPYARGTFSGTVKDSFTDAYRSGLADTRVRFAVNLKGGPAMGIREFLKWNEKRLLGASLTISIPTGQYDSARVVNTGTNRWGFKPELGYTRRWGHWVLDGYAGAWFFTANNAFFPGQSHRTQKPSGAIEGHLGYYVRPRLWVSMDGNFWVGNRSTVNQIEKPDQQRDSRAGVTSSVPITRNQSVKVSYSRGAYVTKGGAFRTLSVGWQYSWITLQ
ncbi:MAG: transporter [Candidatus Solibacter sp.]